LQILPRAAPSEQALFPLSRGVSSWTTLPGAKGALPLSDDTLRPNHVAEGPKHSYVKAPDGRMALRAQYPKGSYRPGADPRGGISFYAPGPESVDLTTAKEATFGYSVMFPDGFEFVKGGKLPGLYGGDNDEISISCSGGRRDSACFSARLMWRPEGAGELYTYLPPYTIEKFAANRKQCDIANSDCNPTYGASISRGSFKFEPGQWTTVSERVKLNDAGKANGELELFVNGKSIINVDGLIFRDDDSGRIRGMQMQSFFGGHTEDWATPKDQDVYFADLSVAILTT
ncbi:polysaccharide lyase family 14 protein, partial [Pholiota molesta]